MSERCTSKHSLNCIRASTGSQCSSIASVVLTNHPGPTQPGYASVGGRNTCMLCCGYDIHYGRLNYDIMLAFHGH